MTWQDFETVNFDNWSTENKNGWMETGWIFYRDFQTLHLDLIFGMVEKYETDFMFFSFLFAEQLNEMNYFELFQWHFFDENATKMNWLNFVGLNLSNSFN